MSVPAAGWPEADFAFVPRFTYTSNASGLFSETALANLTSGHYPVVSLDWEVNYTATKAHHLRRSTIAQARAIVAAAPDTKVLAYQQGFLAMNVLDAWQEAVRDPAKQSWFVHKPDGSVFTWDVNPNVPDYCEYGQHCARVYNASVPEMRAWYISAAALPTLADPSIKGLQVECWAANLRGVRAPGDPLLKPDDSYRIPIGIRAVSCNLPTYAPPGSPGVTTPG
jgi:hypothetical protein